MTGLAVALTLRSPALLAAAPPVSNLTETLRFVPGNSLRGIFARRYLDLGGNPDRRFEELFVTGEIAFGTAWLEGAEPVPLSARTCKYHGGFRADGGHGVVDLLLPAGDGGGCPACGESLDQAPSLRQRGGSRRAGVETRLAGRTAIDPARATARTGQLFFQEVLAEGQRFVAEIEGPPDLVAELAGLLGKGFEAALGTGASRGQGWAEVAPAKSPASGLGSADERFRAFRERAGAPVLAVTLVSDGLFVDDYLRAAARPSLDDLAALGIDPGDWRPEPVRAFAGLRALFGFDGEPVRLPRPHGRAVAAGSAFLFEARGEPAVPNGPGAGWIGDGRREGHGRAVLWHPFHLAPDPGAAAEATP